jgi:hypothetical protein
MPALEVGPGELVDRLTILRLKASRAPEDETRQAAERQMKFVTDALQMATTMPTEERVAALHKINADLWTAEDDVRRALAADDRDEVVRSAAAIVALNGARCRLKADIDTDLGYGDHAEFKIY